MPTNITPCGVLRVCTLACVLAMLCASAHASLQPSGSCELWANTTHLCTPYLTWAARTLTPRTASAHVYIPPGSSQADLSALVMSVFRPELNALPGECRKLATQLLCLTALRVCDPASGGPSLVCLPACQAARGACARVPLPIQCNLTEEVGGVQVDTYAADDVTLVHTGNATVAIPCVGDGSTPDGPRPVCPPHFVFAPPLDTCAPACVDKLSPYPTPTRIAIVWLTVAGAALSVVVWVYLGVPWLLNRRRAMPPNCFPLVGYTCITLFNAGHVLSLRAHPDDFSCVSGWELRGSHDAVCLLQAALHLPMITLGVGWLTATAVHLLSLSLWPVDTPTSSKHGLIILSVTAVVPSAVLYAWGFASGWITNGVDPALSTCHWSYGDALLPLVPLTTQLTISVLATWGSVFVFLWNKWGLQPLLTTLRRLSTVSFFSLSFTFHLTLGIALLWYYYLMYDTTVDSLTERLQCHATGKHDCPLGPHIRVLTAVLQIVNLFWLLPGSYLLSFGRAPYFVTFWRVLITQHRIHTEAASKVRSLTAS
eukprot:CAMPEP_0177632584 /NCGR_PEP_ID=MMETSP0447-20121125/2379_1 /TAXON_ID=0 /ORGANISM="Stygamoeba regulata, Strain BSH-02190019" /LENGTH=539 /DNA_ID=CAMNT_0019134181 /DNA_START=60 /DNA_END=1682 /DNA_ORIENTATION=+